MKILLYILMNPLTILGLDLLAYQFIGQEAALALILLPLFLWIAGNREGFFNYLAGTQVFYVSCYIGGLVLYKGLENGDPIWMIAGAFLLLPAATIATLLVLFS